MRLLQHLASQEKKLDDSSRLDAVEIVRVPDMLPGRAKDLSAPWYVTLGTCYSVRMAVWYAG